MEILFLYNRAHVSVYCKSCVMCYAQIIISLNLLRRSFSPAWPRSNILAQRNISRQRHRIFAFVSQSYNVSLRRFRTFSNLRKPTFQCRKKWSNTCAVYKLITHRNQRDNISSRVHPGKCRQTPREKADRVLKFFFLRHGFYMKNSEQFYAESWEMAFKFFAEKKWKRYLDIIKIYVQNY